MGWYKTCRDCKVEAKYGQFKCDCESIRNADLLKKIIGSTIIESYIQDSMYRSLNTKYISALGDIFYVSVCISNNADEFRISEYGEIDEQWYEKCKEPINWNDDEESDDDEVPDFYRRMSCHDRVLYNEHNCRREKIIATIKEERDMVCKKRVNSIVVDHYIFSDESGRCYINTKFCASTKSCLDSNESKPGEIFYVSANIYISESQASWKFKELFEITEEEFENRYISFENKYAENV